MKRFKAEGRLHSTHHYPDSEEENHSRTGIQEVIQMCSFDAAKSTKGASKMRRDLINAEIANLRDLLPLPSSTRQRLSQLQLMALVCVYVRKANYFQHVFKRHQEMGNPFSTPNIGFSKSLSGFLIMMTQNGKLLYISDNAAEYLGHSMVFVPLDEDLLIHGDSVYDIIDKADHATVQTELLRNTAAPGQGPGDEVRLFLCRMNVSRNARRQMRFGDQKVVLLQGRYLSYLPLCSRNEPVFVGSCTPVAMPETRECVVQGATNVFTSIHSMDMKFMHVDRNGEHYLGYSRQELGGVSWYQLIHWNFMREAQTKHRLISQSEQEKSCILLLKIETRNRNWIWIHCVLQVKDGTESNSSSQPHPAQSIIVATNQVLSDREAAVMRANSWLYHYYTVQTKLQYGLAYPPDTVATNPSVAAKLAAAYFPHATAAAYHAHDSTVPPSYHHHPMVQQSIPSSHNSNGYPHYHPHIPPPHYGFEVQAKGKDSPLDFSLSSTTPSAFDAYYPAHYSAWNHHQSSQSHHHNNNAHHYHGGGNTANGAVTYYSKTGHLSPTWHRAISVNKSRIQISSNISSPSSSSSSSSNGSTPKKKRKHGHDQPTRKGESTTVSPPLSERSGEGSSLVADGPLAIAPVSSYPTGRSRHLWKVDNLMREQEQDTPLSPSPVWEGQTHRVPDLQAGGNHSRSISSLGSYGISSGVIDGLYAATGGSGSGELIHCVPTYLPYVSSSTESGNTASISPYSSPYVHHPYGFHPLAHHQPLSVGEPINGSPNKENRLPLPPTPESDTNENEENKPIKWETL